MQKFPKAVCFLYFEGERIVGLNVQTNLIFVYVHVYAIVKAVKGITHSLFCLLFNKTIKSSDGVIFQTVHGTAPVKDKNDFCKILIHKASCGLGYDSVRFGGCCRQKGDKGEG